MAARRSVWEPSWSVRPVGTRSCVAVSHYRDTITRLVIVPHEWYRLTVHPSRRAALTDFHPRRPPPHIYQQKGTLAPIEGAKTGASQTEDILNSILPPRSHESDGTLWVQNVSATPATRLDVINLQEKLDAQLQARQARGPVR